MSGRPHGRAAFFISRPAARHGGRSDTPLSMDIIQGDTLKTEKEHVMKNKLLRARCRIPMDLQHLQKFAADGGGGGQGGAGSEGGDDGGAGGSGGDKGGKGPVTFTADQLAEISRMLAGGAEAKENKTLQSYFKQQGMSEDEVSEAIKAYKAQRDASKPDVDKLSGDLEKATKAVTGERIRNAALMMTDDLGVNVRTMGYIIKMADLSAVTDKDGNVDNEKLKTALNKVLEDLPQLKPTSANRGGIRKIGADGGQGGGSNDPLSLADAVRDALGTK